MNSFDLTGVDSLTIEGLSGNDSITLDGRNGLIYLPGGIKVLGGADNDTVTFLDRLT